MILTINHETVYRYEEAVRYSTQYLRLTPRCDEGQKVLEWRLDLPTPALLEEDHFGNITHIMTLDMPHSVIRIRATGIVETEAGERMSFGGDPLVFLRATALTTVDALMARFAARFRHQPMTLAALDELADAVYRHLPYAPGNTDATSSAADAFRAESGVCQDHTQIFIACCRYLGVPARYVSGYVHSPALVDLHVASHAWAEAWMDDRWWSFDVVNRSRAGESHLKLAVGMDYLDACPVRGVRRGGCGEVLEAQVSVSRMVSQAALESDSRQSIAQQQQQQQ
jgi:transglutaminase-like putative cysteine protease